MASGGRRSATSTKEFGVVFSSDDPVFLQMSKHGAWLLISLDVNIHSSEKGIGDRGYG